MSNDLTEIFGEPISVYTRAQAIEDGVLVDMSATDGSGLFRFPVAFTAALASDLKVGQGKSAETYNARVWDVCWMLRAKARTCDSSDIYFRVKVGRKVLALRGNCGPGDDGAAVMTIGYPEDF